jgi:hypothetical protein
MERSDLERLVPEYADPIAETPVEVPNARFARLRENFREGGCLCPAGLGSGRRSISVIVGAARSSGGDYFPATL